MAQRIASLYAEIGADTGKLESALGAAKSSIEKTGKAIGGLGGIFDKLNNSTLGKTVTSMTGFQLSTLGAMAAVGKLASAVAEAVGDYSAYAESIDHLAARTGMASEEVSRLVQVSDDFRVSQETLERAMTLALQNGFNPTIDNLAALADRYNAIQDPTQRAAEMQDIFGRQWADLVPLLERGGYAIREASAGISDSLIVTSEAIEANRKYQASLDSLTDSWTGVKYAMTRDFLPGLASAMEELAKSTELQLQGASRNEVIAAAIRRRAAATYDWSDAEREAARAQNAAAAAAAQEYKELAAAEPVITAAERATNAYTESMTAQAESYGHTTRRLWEMKAGLAEYNAMVEQQPALLQAWQDAEANLNVTMQQFSQGYANDVVSALQAAGVEGEKYEKALAAVDEQNGTNILGQHKATQALEEAVAAYAIDGDVDKLTAALGSNKSEWEALDDNVQQAKSSLDEAKASFDALMADIASWSGKTFTINVETGGSGGKGDYKGKKPGVFTRDGMTEMDAATGANFIVPPGYPNDSFRLGLTSGEHAEITPAGQASAAGRASSGSTINIGTIVLPSVTNGQQLINELGKIARRGRVAGAGYAGG